jgi:cytochrome b involved in lipid metabolism
MKKTVGISLFIFFAIVVAILVAGLGFYQDSKLNNIASKTINPSVVKINNATVASNTKLNIAEVAKHNQTSDCYMVINNKVYNLSDYASSHPGGTRMIQNYCGKEATQAFDTKGGRRSGHSSYANKLLNTYYVGDFVQ